MTDVIMPQMGESVVEGTVTRWLKRIGERVLRDEPLLEISTDKVDAEIPSPVTGELVEIRVFEGSAVPVSTVLGVIAEGGDASVPSIQPPDREMPFPGADLAETPSTETTTDEARRIRSSPVVRRIARAHDIDIRTIPGSGIGGRVTKQDILDHVSQRGAESSDTPAAASAPSETNASESLAEEPVPGAGADRTRLVPMSPIRKKTAENMALARRTAAHATTVWDVDMTRVTQLLALNRSIFQERHGVHLTHLPFILKATVDALKLLPILNASVEGDSIRYHDAIHLGIAVALDHGLIVPVIRGADEKSLLGLARALGDLSERARSKRLQVDEVHGGTFTITNPGVFGNLFGAPIIPPPQAGILSVGSIEKRPVAREDAIAIRTTVYLSLSFDHRIVDGADADRFMADLKRRLEGFDESAL